MSSPLSELTYSINGGTPQALPLDKEGCFTITGLVNGTEYTITLTATNANGSTSEDVLVTPGIETSGIQPVITNVADRNESLRVSWTYIPSEPTITGITAGNQSLDVAFNVPENDGNLTITDYEYSLDGGTWQSSAQTVSPITISGLTNGQEYSVRIRAVNALGTYLASNSVVGTPFIPATNWILRDGAWRDDGEWDDDENWIDN
jgi:hypothetical protein